MGRFVVCGIVALLVAARAPDVHVRADDGRDVAADSLEQQQYAELLLVTSLDGSVTALDPSSGDRLVRAPCRAARCRSWDGDRVTRTRASRRLAQLG